MLVALVPLWDLDSGPDSSCKDERGAGICTSTSGISTPPSVPGFVLICVFGTIKFAGVFSVGAMPLLKGLSSMLVITNDRTESKTLTKEGPLTNQSNAPR